ncbi:hypothetical protein BDD43_5320 [Mucilaginibacter gracilis]|uniref:Uncharacterized protein n=1 Tax=Mucilaginibacter gracilis TaxID=423350 RepID=A0A495J9I6_9SPHI|nr:hypothetical protein [Mucilaginibacter gracilis]RKR85064.1 hypothetical protein BDD43_5320 [Mucilaginibacter gracilis]
MDNNFGTYIETELTPVEIKAREIWSDQDSDDELTLEELNKTIRAIPTERIDVEIFQSEKGYTDDTTMMFDNRLLTINIRFKGTKIGKGIIMKRSRFIELILSTMKDS